MTLAEDRCGLPDPRCRLRLAGHDLELHALVREEVAHLELSVPVRQQIRLEVVREELVLVSTRQRVLEGQDVDLLEFGCGVPCGEDLRLCGDDAKPGGLRCIHGEHHVAHLKDLAAEEEPDPFDARRAVWGVLTSEKRANIPFEDGIGREDIRSPSTELQFLEAHHRRSVDKEVGFHAEESGARLALDDDEIGFFGRDDVTGAQHLLRMADLPQRVSEDVHTSLVFDGLVCLLHGQDVHFPDDRLGSIHSCALP
mmetsp:Transcript_30863/g.57887  ORF Transcript_30863/g.57887 Transcript_30863/m.57887 type:complete len:254 (+) Transcript_30863:432-1193(+)